MVMKLADSSRLSGKMHKPFLQFLAGFTWLSWSSLALGLAESFIYGWFIAVLFVPFYNFFDAW
jgi:hypothetical protein